MLTQRRQGDLVSLVATAAAEAGAPLGGAPAPNGQGGALTPAVQRPQGQPGRRGARRNALVLAGLGLLLLAAAVVAAMIGETVYGPGVVAGVVARHLFGLPLAGDPFVDTIVWLDRVPRIATAILVGACLAAAGAAFQGLFRNPLADPAIVGTSAGAAAGAILALLLPLGETVLGFSVVSLAAFGGATAAVFLVIVLGRVGGRAPTAGLLLAGFAVSALLNAGSALAMALSAQVRQMQFWLLGSLELTTPGQLTVVAPAMVVGLALLQALAWDLNVLLLGDEHAAYLGLRVARRRLAVLLVGSLLTGLAVSISGLIGFVGLIVPHIGRLLFGANHRLLLPASALLGGAFLLAADTLVRIILYLPIGAGTELPVGVITALTGAPWFLWLLRRGTRREGGYL